jgi:NADPH:quinone reductase-like Zn-dependent oxidoreductase
MRAWELRGDGLETLTLTERPAPRPGPGQVRVRMRAASLNYRDLLVASGAYARGGPAKRPLVPLSDGAGEVMEVGPGVTTFRAGDRVMGGFFRRWVDGPFTPELAGSALGGGSTDGVLAEEVILEADTTVRFPVHLSFEEAATLPCAGVTAWVGLFSLGRLVPDQWVLAMGTGGVSIFALQFAKAAGAKVVLTSSDDAKLARGKALGADVTINYRKTPAWDEAARAATGGGVHEILEVGGATTLPLSLRAVRPGGHVTLTGLLGGARGEAETAAKLAPGVRVDSVFVGSARHLGALADDVARERLRPVVDRVFPFEGARDAFEHLRTGAHFGKVVVAI